MLWDKNAYPGEAVPPAVLKKLDDLNAQGEEVKQVLLGPGCWLVLFGENGWVERRPSAHP